MILGNYHLQYSNFNYYQSYCTVRTSGVMITVLYTIWWTCLAVLSSVERSQLNLFASFVAKIWRYFTVSHLYPGLTDLLRRRFQWILLNPSEIDKNITTGRSTRINPKVILTMANPEYLLRNLQIDSRTGSSSYEISTMVTPQVATSLSDDGVLGRYQTYTPPRSS